MGDKKEYSLEENFARLDETLELLEKEDLPLEDAFKAYSVGMEIIKLCNDQIDRVEKKVLKLSDTGEPEVFTNGESNV